MTDAERDLLVNVVNVLGVVLQKDDVRMFEMPDGRFYSGWEMRMMLSEKLIAVDAQNAAIG